MIGKNISNELFYGLKRMEYRGYDSCGVAYKKDSNIIVSKSLKSITKLEKSNKNNFDLAIAHTRWATHGRVSIKNAHPHYSLNKKVFLVHNGIIENYLEIKEKYLKSINLYSDTDTCVLVNYLDYLLQSNSIEKSMEIILHECKGSYSFIWMNDKENRIYFLKKDMPLYLGLGENISLVSDLNGLDENIGKYAVIPNYCFGYIEKENYSCSKEIDLKNYVFQHFVNDKKKYKNYMIKEIYDIEKILNNYITEYKENGLVKLKFVKNKIKESNSISLIGAGSSYNASLIGKRYLEEYYNKHVDVFMASEFAYQKYINHDSLFILVSQSGETADLLKCKERIDDYISITNVNTSTLARNSIYNLEINAFQEISVCSTKCYFITVLLFYLLSIEEKDYYRTLLELKKHINELLSQNNNINNIAKKYKKYKSLVLLGRQEDNIANYENSLKIKEITYMNVSNYPAGELKHGSLATCDKNTNVILLNTNSEMNLKNQSNANEVRLRGANVFIVSSYDNYNEEGYRLPKCKKEYNFFLSIVFFELFAYYLSINKGINPDKPRNLAKSVTVE